MKYYICKHCHNIYSSNQLKISDPELIYAGVNCPNINCDHFNDEMKELDELFVPAINELNKAKLYTAYHCSGHLTDTYSSYIMLEPKPLTSEFGNFLVKLNDYTNKFIIKTDIDTTYEYGHNKINIELAIPNIYGNNKTEIEYHDIDTEKFCNDSVYRSEIISNNDNIRICFRMPYHKPYTNMPIGIEKLDALYDFIHSFITYIIDICDMYKKFMP